jgi:hypothetical protein
MKDPLICLSCASKPCQNTEVGTFDICKYGIAFCKRDDFVEKKEHLIQLSNISRNLRHEINPILQTIIEQTTKLDLTLSVKEIDLEKPLSIIIGSTVILDNFIQMITGVHEFHATTTDISKKKIKLKDIIDYHFAVYAILKEEARTKVHIPDHIDPPIPDHIDPPFRDIDPPLKRAGYLYGFDFESHLKTVAGI